MCLCLLTLSYTDTKQVQVFFLQVSQNPTNTLPNHLLTRTFWTPASAWGINLVGTDLRYENEHRPPVCSGCDQSVLISHITLPHNWSTSHVCYMTTGWEQEQAAPVEAEKLQLGVLLFKDRTLGKPQPVTPITHSKALLLLFQGVTLSQDRRTTCCSPVLGD